jgi:hypothetical protein
MAKKMSKKMDMESKKEFSFMKRKGAPKSMMKAEMKEEGYSNGGTVRGMGAATRGGKFVRSC